MTKMLPWRALRGVFLKRFGAENFRRRFPGVVFGEDVIVRGPEKFFPGSGCSIDIRAYLNCAGGAWNGYSGFIKLGDNCEIGANCVLNGAGGITLGNDVHLGPLVTISANQLYRDVRSDDPATHMQFLPVTIQDGALIGPSTCIAPGVVIGRRAIVGAGSAVLTDIPPDCVAQGVPARIVLKKNDSR